MLPTPQHQILVVLQQLAVLQLVLMSEAEKNPLQQTAIVGPLHTLSTGAAPAFPPISCSCGQHCPKFPCWA